MKKKKKFTLLEDIIVVGGALLISTAIIVAASCTKRKSSSKVTEITLTGEEAEYLILEDELYDAVHAQQYEEAERIKKRLNELEDVISQNRLISQVHELISKKENA